MQKLSFKHSVLLAVVSGVVTAFTFPTMFAGVLLPNLGFLAWLSLVPLFVAIYHAGLRRTFVLTFITVFTYYSISLYWLYNALIEFGKLSPLVTVAVLLLMVVILSSYIGLATSWVKWLKRRVGASSIALLPVAWVVAELARNYSPGGGFPWNDLAYSQWGYPVLIQTADLFGIYGILFLIILVNQLLAELVIGWKDIVKLHTEEKAIAIVIIFSLVLAYGWYRLQTVKGRSLGTPIARVAMMQGNIPQEEKWDKEYLEGNLSVYRDYMDMVKDGNVTLTVWPESAFPYTIPLDIEKMKPASLGLDPSNNNGSWLLFGALSSEHGQEEGSLYNSAILVDNTGLITGRYHKNHLVPFGEYVPYRKMLFFAKKLVDPIGDFKAGGGYHPLQVRNFEVAPLVCYEDVFPEISRAMTRNGANILINMTNDAWYGRTSAAHQHMAIAVFRAVENRRYMLRSTNTGVSAVIDPKGRVELKTSLFTKSFALSGIPVLKGLTIYDRIGDTFAYLCVAIVVLLSAMAMIRKKNI